MSYYVNKMTAPVNYEKIAKTLMELGVDLSPTQASSKTTQVLLEAMANNAGLPEFVAAKATMQMFDGLQEKIRKMETQLSVNRELYEKNLETLNRMEEMAKTQEGISSPAVSDAIQMFFKLLQYCEQFKVPASQAIQPISYIMWAVFAKVTFPEKEATE